MTGILAYNPEFSLSDWTAIIKVMDSSSSVGDNIINLLIVSIILPTIRFKIRICHANHKVQPTTSAPVKSGEDLSSSDLESE